MSQIKGVLHMIPKHFFLSCGLAIFTTVPQTLCAMHDEDTLLSFQEFIKEEFLKKNLRKKLEEKHPTSLYNIEITKEEIATESKEAVKKFRNATQETQEKKATTQKKSCAIL
jgi:hypothetical protein